MSLNEISTETLLARLSSAARREYLHKILAQDFSAFVRKVFETVSPGDAYLANWHIDAMTFTAECVVDGKIKRLVTTVPPRHLKSIIFSVALPAYLLGQDPTKRIICVSYSNELAIKHAIDFRAVITSEWYRRVFPKTRVSREKDTQFETMTILRGFRFATSLGGTLTGRGADLIVLDDPQKPEEALSEAQRNSAGQWFDTTLLSRLDSKSEGIVVIVMQRLAVSPGSISGYRFYISTALRGRKHKAGSVTRISALEVESLVEAAVREKLPQDKAPREEMLEHVERIIVSSEKIRITLRHSHAKRGPIEVPWTPKPKGETHPFALSEARTNQKLLKSIIRAHNWLDNLSSGRHASIENLAAGANLHPKVIRQGLRLAFLAPEMMTAALGGEPLAVLKQIPKLLPLSWREQRQAIG
jgi:hypothetical protein